MHLFKIFSFALIFSIGCRAAKVAERATGDVDTAAPDDAADWWEEGTEEPDGDESDGDESESDEDKPDDADDDSDDKPEDWTDDSGDKPDDWDDNSEDKPDDGDGTTGYDECGDDFDPNTPCSGDWVETICVHEGLIWWCEEGTWANEDDKP